MCMLISVAICTRNPRRAYLDRVLEALARQTLPRENWELLIVDSASNHRLSANLAGSTGLACRIIRLDISGLLRARFAAIAAKRARKSPERSRRIIRHARPVLPARLADNR